MSIFGRPTQPAATEPPPAEDQTPGAEAIAGPAPLEDLLADLADEDDLAALADRCQREGDQRLAEADEREAADAADQAMADQAKAAIDARRREDGQAAAAKVRTARSQGGKLGKWGSDLATAAAVAGRVREDEQEASRLEAEREQLAASTAALSAEDEQNTAAQRTADGQLAAARQAGDVGKVGDCLTRIAGHEHQAKWLAGQMQEARDRYAEIGDGTASHPGLLLEARERIASGAGRSPAFSTRYPPTGPALRSGASWPTSGPRSRQ